MLKYIIPIPKWLKNRTLRFLHSTPISIGKGAWTCPWRGKSMTISQISMCFSMYNYRIIEFKGGTNNEY